MGFEFYANKGPDKDPITITFDDTTNPQAAGSKGVLVSRRYSVKALLHKLCQAFGVTTDISEFSFQDGQGTFHNLDPKDKRPLEDLGIGEGTLIASENSHDKMRAKQHQASGGSYSHSPPKPKSEEEKHFDKLKSEMESRVRVRKSMFSSKPVYGGGVGVHSAAYGARLPASSGATQTSNVQAGVVPPPPPMPGAGPAPPPPPPPPGRHDEVVPVDDVADEETQRAIRLSLGMEDDPLALSPDELRRQEQML